MYVYLQDDTDAAAFLESFEIENANQIICTDNAQQMAEIAQEIYSQVSVVLISAIFVLTILIILFILYIVIKSLLVQRKQELGIYKAMGYSNWPAHAANSGKLSSCIRDCSIAIFFVRDDLYALYQPIDFSSSRCNAE